MTWAEDRSLVLDLIFFMHIPLLSDLLALRFSYRPFLPRFIQTVASSKIPLACCPSLLRAFRAIVSKHVTCSFRKRLESKRLLQQPALLFDVFRPCLTRVLIIPSRSLARKCSLSSHHTVGGRLGLFGNRPQCPCMKLRADLYAARDHSAPRPLFRIIQANGILSCRRAESRQIS